MKKLPKHNRPVILVAGVAVVDFVFKVEEMPRLAQKYRARDAGIIGGGCAANAAVAISRLGGRAILSGRIGEDIIGDMILQDLKAERVDTTLVRRFEGHRSSFSSVYIDGAGERQIVSFRDTTMSFAGDWLEASFPAKINAALADTRWPEGAAAAMAGARRLGVPGIIDAEPPTHEAGAALQLASHIAFSRQGLAEFSGAGGVEDGLRICAGKLQGFVCVTDGAKGVWHFENGKAVHTSAFAVEAVDTLGAGDVWHGAFTLRLAEGANEAAAIVFANAVSALKCTRFGGRKGTPGRAEVEEFLAARGNSR